MPQLPSDSSKGAILTIGLVIGRDRAALVMPVGCASTENLTPEQIPQHSVEAFKSLFTGLTFLSILADEAFISYIAAIGMDNQTTPYREDYSTTSYPGTGGALGPPPSVGALTTFYADYSDLPPNSKTRHSRMVIPGLPADSIVNGMLTSNAKSLIEGIASDLVAGVAHPVSNEQWSRYLSAPPSLPQGGQAGAPLVRLASSQTRWYLGTQRRRITPH